MSALPIIITTAGLQALVNAQNTGVSNVVVAALGVSPNQVAVTAATTAIPGEIKRIPGVAGMVTAEDTIYVSAADQTQDTYTVRTVALYLSDGTLFAAYSQAAPLVEKAGPSQAVLEASVKLSAPLAGAIQFEGGGWVNPPASETVAGVLRLATVDEAVAGVNHSKAVTPKGLKAVTAAMMAAIQATFDQIAQTLAGKANTDHKHAAADVTSGTFNEARIPSLPQNRITGLIDALAGKALVFHSHVMADIDGLVQALNGKSAVGHKHDATDTNSGVFDVGRIPALAMEKITGLATALAAKATLGVDVFFNSIRLGNGGALLYAEGDKLSVRSGASAAEQYYGFLPDGSFRAYNGPIFAAGGRVWDPSNFDPNSRLPMTRSHISNNPDTAPLGASSGDANIGTGLHGWHWMTQRRDGSGWGVQTAITDTLADEKFMFRRSSFDGSWGPWRTVWTSVNFNPSLKADMASPSFTGTGYFGTDKRGQIWLMGGDDRAGVMEFRVDGVRYGFIGFGDGPGGNPYFGSDNGKVWVFTHRPSFAGYMPWDTANLAFASGAEVVAGAEYAKMISPAGLFAFAKSLASSGYAVIPGTGLMVQWGVSTASTPEGQVHATLPTAFGGGCLVALAVPRNPSSNLSTDFFMQVVSKHLDRIVFYANRANGSSGNMDGYEWIALGRVSGTPDPAYSGGGGGEGGGGGGGGGGQIEV